MDPKLLLRALRHPRRTYSYLARGFDAPDRVFATQAAWRAGALPRRPLAEILPEAAAADVSISRVCDRTWRTSVTESELCALLAIARAIEARNALEIGTFDGNTTVNLARNVPGTVTTVDLPPDFTPGAGGAAFPGLRLNVTDRRRLAEQINRSPERARIRQVHGDSATIDWSRLGGPFDLVFIDGCHLLPYVESDTRNARAHLAQGGAIVWHDYGMIEDVSRVVDATARSAEELDVHAIEGTRLALALSRERSGG